MRSAGAGADRTHVCGERTAGTAHQFVPPAATKDKDCRLAQAGTASAPPVKGGSNHRRQRSCAAALSSPRPQPSIHAPPDLRARTRLRKHAAKLLQAVVKLCRVGPTVAGLQDLAGHAGHRLRDLW
eukprot:366022-Chlamydomonas_euryale.AAC.5